MDQQRFDRIAAALGGATTRRAGLKAAMAALLGLGTAAATPSLEAAPRRNAPGKRAVTRADVVDEKRPCGPTAKANRCKTHKDCCTKYCRKPTGIHRIGRCRCIKVGKKCKPSQTCCGGATCRNKRCRVQSGCGEVGGACTSDTECCTGLVCTNGACAPCVLTVCASCAYQAVQPAIAALEGTAGNTIYIDSGTYTEDLTITDSVTLATCGGAVTIKNATAGRRTIELPSTQPADAGSGSRVEIRNITVTTDTVSPNFGGGIGAAIDGSGDVYDAYANLILSGTTKVTKGRTRNLGGCVNLTSYSTLTMQDDAEISGCSSDTYGGGGVYGQGTTMLMQDRSAVRNNVAGNQSDGGGIRIYEGVLELSGNATVSGNQSGGKGGGIYVQSYVQMADSYGLPVFSMKDASTVTGNTSSLGLAAAATVVDDPGGGGVAVSGDCDGALGPGMRCVTVYLSGSSTITGNVAGQSGKGTTGGGLALESADLALSDSASITGNYAYVEISGTTGSQVMSVWDSTSTRATTVTMTDSSFVEAQCRIVDSVTDTVTNC